MSSRTTAARVPASREAGPIRRRAPAWLPIIAVALASCAPTPPPAPPSVAGASTPRPARVTDVLFLVGDPGDAIPGRSPLLAALAADVESWSAAIRPDGVRVAFLGDLVYPVGIRPESDPDHATDTLALHAQLAVLSGPAARERGAELWFIPGNHDWGNVVGDAGRRRLARMEERIERWSAAGHRVRMVPEDGELGPVEVPISGAWRAVVLDTQGWLGGSDEERAAAAAALRDLLSTPDVRTVLLAHHPLRTGGNHGLRPLNDPLALPSRAGAIVQDLSSRAYSRMKTEIEAAIGSSRAPDLAAYGHDHNLQLFRAPEGAPEPRWTLVSGSASKLTPVSDAPDMVFGGRWPGYGRLFLLDDGSAILQVTATDPGYGACLQEDPAGLDRCMRDGSAAFRTIWSDEIASPTDSGDAPTDSPR